MHTLQSCDDDPAETYSVVSAVPGLGVPTPPGPVFFFSFILSSIFTVGIYLFAQLALEVNSLAFSGSSWTQIREVSIFPIVQSEVVAVYGLTPRERRRPWYYSPGTVMLVQPDWWRLIRVARIYNHAHGWPAVVQPGIIPKRIIEAVASERRSLLLLFFLLAFPFFGCMRRSVLRAPPCDACVVTLGSSKLFGLSARRCL